jgi:hypothetical protein
MPSDINTWIPHPLFCGDTSMMELATRVYNTRGSSMINRCRIFLQTTSVGNLLLYPSHEIHPSYVVGNIPPSRASILLWPKVINRRKTIGNYGAHSWDHTSSRIFSKVPSTGNQFQKWDSPHHSSNIQDPSSLPIRKWSINEISLIHTKQIMPDGTVS